MEKNEVVVTASFRAKSIEEKVTKSLAKIMGLEEPYDLGNLGAEKLVNPFGGGELILAALSKLPQWDYSDIGKPVGVSNSKFAIRFSAIGSANPDDDALRSLLQRIVEIDQEVRCVYCLIVYRNDSVKCASLCSGENCEVWKLDPSQAREKQRGVLERGKGETLNELAEYYAWDYRWFE